MGGFMSSTPVQQVQPSPVEKIPGLQNLGQQLMQMFQQMLSGQLRQQPYQGFQSVYGGPGGTFPGLYTNPSVGQTTQPSQTQPSFQQLINNILSNLPTAGAGTQERPEIMKGGNR
jgi:hypothetical protein